MTRLSANWMRRAAQPQPIGRRVGDRLGPRQRGHSGVGACPRPEPGTVAAAVAWTSQQD